MEKRFDVFGMCNALFDIQAEVSDEVLSELSLGKGGMMLISEEEQRAIVPRIYTAIVNTEAGGSGANTMIGVGSVPRDQIRAALCFGASPWQVFRMVRFPATVSHMLTGMRLAMGTCFSTIVAAELLAPEAGLGYLIFSARTWMQTEVAFVGIVLLGLLGFAADRLFQLATTRLFARYRPR